MPRSAARVEQIGPFTLFIRVGHGWPYYGRPSLGAKHFEPADVRRVTERQRELAQPETLEWVAESSPELLAAAIAAGLVATCHPLMVLDTPPPPMTPAASLEIRRVTVDDDLALLGAIAPIAFGAPGTSVGTANVDDVQALAATAEPRAVEFRRARLDREHSIMAVALLDGQPVGIGSHQPLGGVTEITGIGVLPFCRRRGIGARLTSFLVHEALGRGIDVVFLSAGDETIGRVYERLGFSPRATARVAAPVGEPT